MYKPRFLKKMAEQEWCWPAIDHELLDAKSQGMLEGRVLNAGAGWRDISHLVGGELYNQDLPWEGDRRTDIHIYSPIHNIPKPDGFFDTVLCIAVLEHVENPEEIIPEFFRVTKEEGYVIASVPFLQPEHKVPTDFQRYTRDGLQQLFTKHGFEVVSIKPLFSVYHTLHWIVYEWLQLKRTFTFRMLRYLLLPALGIAAKRSSLQSDVLASVFQVVAKKPASLSNSIQEIRLH